MAKRSHPPTSSSLWGIEGIGKVARKHDRIEFSTKKGTPLAGKEEGTW